MSYLKGKQDLWDGILKFLGRVLIVELREIKRANCNECDF